MVGPNPQISTSNNRITPHAGEQYTYDSSGNLTTEKSGEGLAYDAENKLVQYAGGSTQIGGADYFYDGDGKRVKKATPSQTTIFVYNMGGQLVAEYTSSTPESNGTSYVTSDTLGTPRVITKADDSLRARHDYLPFGEEISAGVGSRTASQGYVNDNNRFKFVGYERDGETGFDYAGARYYGSTMGRFTSVDPLMTSGTLYDPKTWNRYSYAINNPLKWTDPDGLYIWSASLGGNATDEELRRRAGNNRNALRDANRIIEKRGDFRNALAAAGRARDALPAGAERDLVSGSLASYGAEGTANGVSVSQGRLADGVAAEARIDFQTAEQAPFATTTNVEVVLSDRGSGNLTIDVAHEGRHVADAQAFAAAFSAEVANDGTGEIAVAGALNMTKYEREVRGYNVSSAVAQGLSLDNFSVGGREIWNRGWAQADRATRRATAIDHHLRDSPTYRLTPNTNNGNPGPGPRFFPRP